MFGPSSILLVRDTSVAMIIHGQPNIQDCAMSKYNRPNSIHVVIENIVTIDI